MKRIFKSEKIRFILIQFLVILVIIIGFNGYLKPNQTRVFGDSFPQVMSGNPESGFEYYQSNFEESLKPYYNVPFRYNLDLLKFYSTYLFGPDIALWLTSFLPLLISIYLSIFFFVKLLGRKEFFGYLLWFFWTFSTFFLFSASIHTHIVISINFGLFYLFLTQKFFESKIDAVDCFKYIFFSSLILIATLTFEMRMAIVTAPLFIIIFGTTLYRYFKQNSHKKVYFVGRIIPTFVTKLFLIIGSFSFLLVNFRSISNQVGSLISRPSWGNQFFQLINSLTFSHPFWRIGTPQNFVYGYPEPVYFINLFLVIFALGGLIFFLFKKFNIFWVYLIPVLFYGFMSKQNNPPIPDVYEMLYKYPYFSFSREASKYYYGLIISIIIILAFNYKNIKNKIVKSLLIILLLIPSVLNFFIFTTHAYQANTVKYPYNINAYASINNFFEAQAGKEEVLWFPYRPTLQYNTDNVKHYSFGTIITQYPLNNLRKQARNYLFYSAVDPNFRKFIQTLGVNYIVIPDYDNEKIMFDEFRLLYEEFNYDSFKSYLELNLNLKELAQVQGYRIYSFEKQDVDYSIVKKLVNPYHLDIGEISLENEKEVFNKLDNSKFKQINDLGISLNNCNNDPSKNLGFRPEDRITLRKEGSSFALTASAKYEEVPCVFLDFELPQEYPYLYLKDFEGDPIELVMFDSGYPKIINIKKVFTLDERSVGLIPVFCGNPKCHFGIYLYGDQKYNSKLINFEGQFITLPQEQATLESDDSILLDNTIIRTLKGQKLNSENYNSYRWVAFTYFYEYNYVLQIGNEVIHPTINNHNLLLFDLSRFGGKITPDNVIIKYTEEGRIQPPILFSQFILLLVAISNILVFGFSFITLRIKRKSI